MTSIVLPRRRLLLAAASTSALGGLSSILAHAQAPAVVTSDRVRPGFPSGVQSGDVLADRGVVWARSDRPARLWVEWATTPGFANARRLRGAYALESTDHTARIDLTGLPAGQDIFYRVQWESLRGGELSEPMAGHFRTAPSQRRDVRFVWSGDTVGQGWGFNEGLGGMTIYDAMRRRNPDFFIHSGDNIYADGPIASEVKLADGTLWRNLTTEEKSKVAETLKEFRGAYRYNMLDANLRRFNAEVMQIWQWDDHEVVNNYSGSKDLSADARYTDKSVPLLTARGARAFLENAPMRWHAQEEEERVYRKIGWGPLLDVFVIDMRSYRGPNSYNRQDTLNAESQYLGPQQGDVEGDCQRHAHRPGRARRQGRPGPAAMGGGGQWRWPGAGPRDRDRAAAVVHQARAHPQHGVADGRRALHRRAPLPPEPRAVPGLRAVLGIRQRPAQRRHLRPESAGQHLRPRDQVHEGTGQWPGQPAAHGRPAVLRRGADRCQDGTDDGAAARPDRRLAVGDDAGAAARVMPFTAFTWRSRCEGIVTDCFN
jgi:hypothetical protein